MRYQVRLRSGQFRTWDGPPDMFDAIDLGQVRLLVQQHPPTDVRFNPPGGAW